MDNSECEANDAGPFMKIKKPCGDICGGCGSGRILFIRRESTNNKTNSVDHRRPDIYPVRTGVASILAGCGVRVYVMVPLYIEDMCGWFLFITGWHG